MVTDEERELSALLERVVPQLPAPAQRLERVRERMRRRRRRRAAAGASAAAVVVVAAAGLLLSGPVGTSSMPGQRARAASGIAGSAMPGNTGAPAATGGGTASRGPTEIEPPPSTMPPSAMSPGSRVYSFADLSGLWLVVPTRWYALEAAKDSAYVSSQRLGMPKDHCVRAREELCTPLVRTLDRGGSLVQLTLDHNKPRADKARLLGRTVGPTPAEAACRAVGGTVELGAEFPGPVGSDLLIEATACLARPTSAQQDQTRDVLTTAGFQ